MKIEKDLSHIAHAVALANANGNQVAPAFQGILEQALEEKLNEEFTLEHGVQHASERDIEDEFVSLDSVESDKDEDDFDNDENLVDMSQVSGSLREIFGE